MFHGFWDSHVAIAAYFDWQNTGSRPGYDLDHWDTGIKQLLHRWETEFPRLAELRSSLPSGAFDNWFDTIPSSAIGNYRAQYEVPETELRELSAKAWLDLKDKVVKQAKSTKDELMSILHEATGYCRLKKFLLDSNIEFDDIHEPDIDSDNTRPEWQAVRGNKIVAALEVKTVFRSDYEKKWLQENERRTRAGEERLIRRGDPRISGGLWNKLNCDIEKAREQLHAVATGRTIPRLVLIVMYLDWEIDAFEVNKQLIENYLDNKSDNEIIVLHDVRSVWR